MKYDIGNGCTVERTESGFDLDLYEGEEVIQISFAQAKKFCEIYEEAQRASIKVGDKVRFSVDIIASLPEHISTLPGYATIRAIDDDGDVWFEQQYCGRYYTPMHNLIKLEDAA